WHWLPFARRWFAQPSVARRALRLCAVKRFRPRRVWLAARGPAAPRSWLLPASVIASAAGRAKGQFLFHNPRRLGPAPLPWAVSAAVFPQLAPVPATPEAAAAALPRLRFLRSVAGPRGGSSGSARGLPVWPPGPAR